MLGQLGLPHGEQPAAFIFPGQRDIHTQLPTRVTQTLFWSHREFCSFPGLFGLFVLCRAWFDSGVNISGFPRTRWSQQISSPAQASGVPISCRTLNHRRGCSSLDGHVRGGTLQLCEFKSCVSLFSVTTISTITKINLGEERVCLILQFTVHKDHRERKSRQSLKAGT